MRYKTFTILCLFKKILTDSVGFAGTELIRRTVGLAHVKDLENIVAPQLRAECESKAINLGQVLILNYQNITNIRDIIGYIEKTPGFSLYH